MARGAPGEAVAQPEVSAEDLPRKHVPEMSGTSFGSGITNIADVLEKKYQADSATWAGNELAKFSTQAVQSLQQAKDAQPADQDPSTFTDNYLKTFDQQSKPFANSQTIASNPFAHKMITQGITDLRQKLQDHTLAWQSNQQVAYRENSFYDQLKSQSAVVEAHPELKGSVGSTLTDVANAIGGDPSKRLEHMRAVDSTLSLAAANGLTRGDPRSTLQALNDPENAQPAMRNALQGLSDAQREAVRTKANEHLGDAVYSALEGGNIRSAQVALSKNLDLMDPKTADTLQRTINSTAEHNMVLADKQQRDASNNLLKNAILMQKQGQLTPQWIEQHHATWEPQAYEYAYNLLSGKETQTNPRVFAPLLQKALGGQDVTAEAQAGLYSGDLKMEDYKTLVEKSEAPRKGYVARGADYIGEALKPSPLVQDPAGARAHANALDDWRQWTDEHPNASETEARTTYRNLTDHYQIIAADKATVFMPVPLHLVGSRMQPDIMATAAATKAAHDSGEMSDEEYRRQTALVMQWQAAVQKKTSPKAAQ